MRPLLIPLGHDLVLGDAGATAWAPRHDVMALVEPTLVVHRFQKVPDRIVVFVRHREVRVVPIHPVTKPDGLVSDAISKAEHPLLAAFDEVGNAKYLDIALVG